MRSLATTAASLNARAVPAASPTSQVKTWLWCLRGPCAPLVLSLRSSRRMGACRHRLGRIDEHRQFLVLDLDQIDGVGRNVAILGHDERDLLALEQHFVIGQYGLNIAGQCRHPMQLEWLQVVGGEHRLDTGQLERRVFLDRFDPGVTVGRPDEITEQHTRQLEIAPSATMTADMSSPGSPFATLPPRVPQYRTCGSAICNEVSANDRARRREQLRSDQFVLGGQRPMTT